MQDGMPACAKYSSARSPSCPGTPARGRAPRNRRLADIVAKCGLVERSGQGMNLIFERSIEQGKPLPDFSGTDAYQVRLTLHGQVQDPNFVRFLWAGGEDRS